MKTFAETLIQWYQAGHRDLPWRRTRDPYAIWLSETMLQQTRAGAAIPYYERFLARFPDLGALARAPEAEVLAAWSGLGYYHRARNLLRAAQRMEREGGFPATYDGIRALPGVGEYTAAAVASIAYELPHAVLDGNVLRVVARVMADPGDIGAGVTRRRFQAVTDGWLDREKPGTFNQALMELGATVCLPRNPQCLLCPVARFCQAREQGRQAEFPVKAAKARPAEAASDLLLAERGEEVLLRQRGAANSRMAGFWELPDVSEFPESLEKREAGDFRHTIVNTRFAVRVFRAQIRRAPPGMRWVRRGEFDVYPVTTVTRKALAIAKE